MAAALRAFIKEVDEAISQSSRERRAGMVRHLTDFLLIGSEDYSDEEIALVDDVLVRLVETIEESARALLAIRLGPLAKAPAKTLRILANDDAIDVASPILAQCEQLDDPILIRCAKNKGQEHLLAISRRKVLTEAVTDILVVRGDQQVCLSAARNSGAKFSDNGFSILVKRSDGDDLLAVCVGTRSDIPPRLFAQLLQTASAIARSTLANQRPLELAEVSRAVSDVTAQIKIGATSQPSEYAAAHVLITSLSLAGQLTSSRLEVFAKARRFVEITVALAYMSEMPTAFIERMLDDGQPESLLILSKAIGLSWGATKSIIELHDERRPNAAGRLKQCSEAFLRLNRSTAEKILAFQRSQRNAEEAFRTV